VKLIALSVCVLLILTGCSRHSHSERQSADPRASSMEAKSSDATSGNDQSPVDPEADPLEDSFAKVNSNIPGIVGVAIATDSGVRSFGPWVHGPAWSTIKVPLAIAALRHSAETASPFVPLAIRDSDNFAAEDLWAQLGQPNDAAEAVGAILKEGGDDLTKVETQRKRGPRYTAFGQTDWSNANQATFMAGLPCLSDSEPVMTDMKSLAAKQQWGMALRTDAAAKGGWGPSPEDAYLVRQVATITTSDGYLGVALSAQPQDGSFDSGVAQIGRLAEWVGAHLDAFTAKKCPS
jgi:hypothetical protein